MIHCFQDLKDLCRKGVALRYVAADTGANDEFDFPDEDDPRDEFLATATLEESMEVLSADAELSAFDPAPAGEDAPAGDSNPYLDFDLSPADVAKLKDHGVRPTDAVDAGLTHVTSSEGAFHLNRMDTGEFEGILIAYRLLGNSVSHCRIILDTPVRLKSSKGRLVPII